MYLINRAAIVVRPKAAFFDWAATLPGEQCATRRDRASSCAVVGWDDGHRVHLS